MQTISKSLSIFTLVLFTSCAATVTTTQSDTNPELQLATQLGNAVLWYQQSAEMRLAYYQAYEYGKMRIDNTLKVIKTERKLAVVLDIDETVLDNSPYEAELIKAGKTYGSATWKEWIDMAQAEALPGAIDFVNYAKSKQVKVFYISNRKVAALAPTIENMKQLNFPNADEAHILLKEATSDKTARRAKIEKDYEVILYVGDNLTDYAQLYADRGADMGKGLVDENKPELLNRFVMLPNPMYGEWEGALYENDFSISNEQKLEKRKAALKGY